MRTKFLLLLIFTMGIHLYSSQSSDTGTEITYPTPAAASLATYNNVPVSMQTGVPDISYPLISVPTNSKKVQINLGLNYHSGNTGSDQGTGNVGKGWTLLGPSMISKELIADFDEKYDDAEVLHVYKKNEFDDMYNFSIPGESGKFRILRDTINNTFQILQLTPYTSKIEYHRNNNNSTLIIDSFTVTSDTGIQYKFQEYDISRQNVFLWAHPWNGGIMGNKKYRSAYHLTSILDEKNIEIVKYTYFRDIKQVQGDALSDEEYNKLVRIEIKDHGIIEINNEKVGRAIGSKDEEFELKNIVFKTFDQRFIKKYVFGYSAISDNFSRLLDYFKQIDSNNAEIEKYQFEYIGLSNNEPDQTNVSATLLRSVYLPTGGIIRYNFEIAPYDYTQKTITTDPVIEEFANVSFDKVNNGVKKYFFTVSSAKDIIIDAQNAGNLLNHSWSLQFFKKVGSTYQLAPYAMGSPIGYDPNAQLTRTINFEPGEYYAEVHSNDLNVQLFLPALFTASEKISEGGEKIITIPLYRSSRIKSIQHFNGVITNPVKSVNYDYSKFSNPSTPSGVQFDEGIIYTNIKITQSGDNGYSKYYFDTAYDYPQTLPYWPYYNITSKGVMKKKEDYNAVGQMVSENIFEYTMQEFDAPSYYLPSSSITVKTGWMREERVISKNYFSSGMIEAKKEVFRSLAHRYVSLEKSTSFDGSIQETHYLYPQDKNHQRLLAANITSTPLEVKAISKKNAADAGIQISKTETKYDNPAYLQPSSVVSYDSQNKLASEVTFNRYDAKGNPEQYTTKDGIPVSFVWGYSKTQPIAKIEGATYAQIEAYITDIVNKSNADVNDATEVDLQNALDTFRTLPQFSGFQITTYVYDPLVGMKTTTPPSGIRAVYRYDNAGRLKHIEDENGNILKKHEYNYSH